MKNIFKKIVVYLLELEAKMILKKYKPTIVAVTGSVGKTSTKDAVYTVLAPFFTVRKSEKSFNSEIGLPLTILGVPNAWNNFGGWIKNLWIGLMLIVRKHPYPAWLVLEMGAGKPGDIKRFAKWVKIDYAIFTWIGEIPVHVEFFKSKDHLIEEKSSLIGALKENGTLILNYDNETIHRLSEKAPDKKIVMYGFNTEATLFASNDSFIEQKIDDATSKQGISFKLNYSGNSIPVFLGGSVGRNSIYAGLAALSVAYAAGLNMLEAAAALASYETPPGRLRLISGINHTSIIDDTYNASPDAVFAALDTLARLSVHGRKIVILGDMLELGKHTEEAHHKVGEQAEILAALLIVVGMRARVIAAGAMEAGLSKDKIIFCDTAYEAGRQAKNLLKEGDIVLVKGSQGMRMERVVEALMANPEKKKELLARQEKEWLDKP